MNNRITLDEKQSMNTEQPLPRADRRAIAMDCAKGPAYEFTEGGLSRQRRRALARKFNFGPAVAAPPTRAAIAKVTLGSAGHAACTRAGVTVYQASTKVGAKVFQPGDCLAIGRRQRRALKSITNGLRGRYEHAPASGTRPKFDPFAGVRADALAMAEASGSPHPAKVADALVEEHKAYLQYERNRAKRERKDRK